MEEFVLPPSMAIALDVFGQVIAYRAACVTDIRWLSVRTDRAFPRDRNHHGGRRIDEWALQAQWELVCRLGHGVYPRSVRFSPATRDLLQGIREETLDRRAVAKAERIDAEQEAMERWVEENATCDRRRPLLYKSVGPKSDIHEALAGGANRSVFAQTGFLTVLNMLRYGGWGGREMPRKFCSLVVWLHAAPWYIEDEDPAGKDVLPVFTIEDWCQRQFMRFGGDVLGKETEHYNRDYRLWIKRGAASSNMPSKGFLSMARSMNQADRRAF